MPQCDNRAVLHLIDKALEYREYVLSSSPVSFQVLFILRDAIMNGKMDVTLTEPLDDVA
jgi:hypothetical protein